MRDSYGSAESFTLHLSLIHDMYGEPEGPSRRRKAVPNARSNARMTSRRPVSVTDVTLRKPYNELSERDRLLADIAQRERIETAKIVNRTIRKSEENQSCA